MGKSDGRVYTLPGLGAKLTTARESAGLSQSAAAVAATVDRASLSLYERDLKAPTLPVLYRLAEAYGVTPCDLLPAAALAELPKDVAGQAEPPAAEVPKPRAMGKRK